MSYPASGGSGLSDCGLDLVVPGNEGDQSLYLAEALLLGGGKEMGVARCLAVNAGATESLHGDLLAEDGFDHLGTGDEHLRNVVNNKHEVGQRR